MTHSETIYINTNEHYRASVETETRSSFCKMVERQISTHAVAKQSYLTTHSFYKESEEIDLIQKLAILPKRI
jgi:Xaa-Pro aminopeptidase